MNGRSLDSSAVGSTRAAPRSTCGTTGSPEPPVGTGRRPGTLRAMTILDELLDERGVLLVDGAMGTELFARGLDSGGAPELWNVEHPDRVTAVHAEYIA